MARREFALARLIRYMWEYKLTPPGRVLVTSILLTALGSVTSEIPVYQLFCGLLALLAVTEALSVLFRPRLEITGRYPERAAVGIDVSVPIRVRNLSRIRPAFDLMLGMFGAPPEISHVQAEQCLPRLGPGESATLQLTLRAAKRGIYPLPPLYVFSTFPFNIERFGRVRLEAGRLVVFPSYQSLEEFEIPLSFRYQHGGVSLSESVGYSSEYIGSREYVAGDAVRHIDSKAWARTGSPVVKEYHEEFCSRVALVLDTHLPGRRVHSAAERRLEAAVAMVAAMAERLRDHSHRVDLFAVGPELYEFRTSVGGIHFDSVLEILAGVDRCRQNPFELMSPLIAEHLGSLSTVMCVFLDWGPARAEFIRCVVESGCALRGVLIVDDATVPPPEGLPEDWPRVAASDVLEGRVVRL